MCNCHCHPQLQKLGKYISALHCPTRWEIIDCIGDGSKSTKEIYEFLGGRGAKLTSSGLYYHLSALNRANIIEVAEYREKGGGAPEKVWKLKTREIVINLLGDEVQES
ncbi:MAG: ArsR family transcriptional regulator [Methanosarcinales archaeon]|nr:MAG: ArsR family transcriptional regulator [Methanosarcinales archaeon]